MSVPPGGCNLRTKLFKPFVRFSFEAERVPLSELPASMRDGFRCLLGTNTVVEVRFPLTFFSGPHGRPCPTEEVESFAEQKGRCASASLQNCGVGFAKACDTCAHAWVRVGSVRGDLFPAE